MKIELLYIEDCPNHLAAADRLRTILHGEGMPVEISEIEVKDAAAAKKLNFFGSPTIRIDGEDIEPDLGPIHAAGLACRCYEGGLPSGEIMRTALRRARQRKDMPGGVALSSLAAVGGVLAASSCCLPLFPFMMAAGLAGSSAFLSAARPYLMAASVVFIAGGFYQARRAKKCLRRTSVISSILLWASALFVFVSIFFPQVMANAAANLAR